MPRLQPVHNGIVRVSFVVVAIKDKDTAEEVPVEAEITTIIGEVVEEELGQRDTQEAQPRVAHDRRAAGDAARTEKMAHVRQQMEQAARTYSYPQTPQQWQIRR